MKYELVVVLKPLLPEDIRANVLKALEKTIKDNKGRVISQDIWGKKHLAYQINKHEEGYYLVYQLELTPVSISLIEKEMKLMNDILRYLFTKVK